MNPIVLFSLISWISLPTIMFGGYSLLRLINKDGALTPFALTYFRAGHAHAGVLVLASLFYMLYLERFTPESAIALRWIACSLFLVGVLATSGGFFLHIALGRPGKASPGTWLTTGGAIILTSAIILLIYAIVSSTFAFS